MSAERSERERLDLEILRRYIGPSPNVVSYRADRSSLSVVEGSYKWPVTRSEAVAALDRIEARYEKQKLTEAEAVLADMRAIDERYEDRPLPFFAQRRWRALERRWYSLRRDREPRNVPAEESPWKTLSRERWDADHGAGDFDRRLEP